MPHDDSEKWWYIMLFFVGVISGLFRNNRKGK